MTSGSRSGGRGRGTRRPAVVDAELWDQVAASVEPLKRRRSRPRKAPDPVPQATAAPEPEAKPEPVPRPKKRSAPPAVAARPDPKPPARRAPDLSGIDRRTRQKLLRGQVEVDARIDLHGSTRLAARGRLLGFLAGARARGHRTVLVITGKGEAPFARHTLHGSDHFHAPERQGVLRQAVTEWLSEPDFAAVVSGFQPAHPRHGGGGAFYVRVRRRTVRS